MLRYIGIAPLSLLIVMVLYFGMHGLLNQPQSIEFLENESEFSFEDYQTPETIHICGLRFTSKEPMSKAELQQETRYNLARTQVPIYEGFPADLFQVNSAINIKKISQTVLKELITKKVFTISRLRD